MNSTPLFDRIIDLLASLAGGLILFMMLSICIDVVLRYFLNRPLTWGVEISEYILLWSTLLSVAWVLKIEGHVKILVNTITSILGAITCLVLLWYGTKVSWEFFERGTITNTILELPSAPLFAIIPIGSFLLFIQFLRRSYGYLKSWKLPSNKED
jgi:TRAP-type C4-dicarboxylate transport system permease small subunit